MKQLMAIAAHLGALAAVLMAGSPATAATTMPVAQQNALVHQYCAVCHTDTARNGGLSLAHFDAATAAPSLAAMMLSKLTGGVSLETAKAASSDPNAAALVATKMRSGAMGAAGIPIPDKATIDALIAALASEATGATEWNLNRTEDHATSAPLLTASILRETLSANTGEAVMFRLVLSCNAATREGGIQLAWAPLPKTGALSVTIDHNAPRIYEVEGKEKMGNGSQVTAGPSSIGLFESALPDSATREMPLPKQALRIEDLFPDQPVEFPFGDLIPAARESLAPCFK